MSDFRVKVYGEPSTRVVFLFCPFNIPQWQMALPGLPIWRLVRAGFQVVAYDYDSSIATMSAEATIRRLELILREAAERLERYQAEGVREYCAFGVSMGTNLAVNLAARHSEITRLVLNVSYSNIADHILCLPGLIGFSQRVWERYIANSGGAEGMHRLLDPYSPLNLVDQLAGKRVLLYLARRDRLMQYHHTHHLVAALKAAGCRLTYYENRHLGHFGAALRNNMQARRYLDFLAS